MSALYLHIPFCRSRCLYCSFTTFSGLAALHHDYVQALKSELASVHHHGGRRTPLTSLFVGGGTPTVLEQGLLCGLLEYTLGLFGGAGGAEISIEANPGTVDPAYLKDLRKAGVNRISFGVQSFSDSELQANGRIHRAGEAVEAVRAAQEAGFTNINVDLMYGLPNQIAASWRKSLVAALSLGVCHLSLYQLTVEEGTPMAREIDDGILALPDEDEVELMDKITKELTRESGFRQYEISNFCRPGCRCQHNIGYWQNREYMAAGVAAVSYLDGVREKRVATVPEYIRRIRENRAVVAESENLGREESFRETVIMGLRMLEGVSLHHLHHRYGLEPVSYYGRVLADLVGAGFVEVTGTHMKITEKGRPISNQIMSELV